jgi:hypothetical protein
MNSNELHIVSRDDDIQEFLVLEFKRLGDRAPIQNASVLQSLGFNSAVRRLKESPPAVAILDTKWSDGKKTARDVLHALRDSKVCCPILLIVRSQKLAVLQSVVDMTCSAPNVSAWLWTGAPPDLHALFSPLLGDPGQLQKSRLRATVHIADECIYWDVEKDGVPVFKKVTSPSATVRDLEDDTNCAFKLKQCTSLPDLSEPASSRGNSLWRKLPEPWQHASRAQ